LASVDGTAALTLGSVLGAVDAAALTEELGSRFDVTRGYFKRHASCSYTHAAADAVLELRRRHADLRAEDIVEIDVATHRLAAPLDGTAYPTRLAAMFSLPYVVATAITEGACTPVSFDAAHRADVGIRRLAAATRVHCEEDLDVRLPAERPARVTLRLRDGRSLVAEAPNPIGDADHQPFGRAEISDKLTRLLGQDDATTLARIVESLPHADDVSAVLKGLP
jgi:2-methylcitrate dehydratase PrpD